MHVFSELHIDIHTGTVIFSKWPIPIIRAHQHSQTILQGLYFYSFQNTFMVLTFIFHTHPVKSFANEFYRHKYLL